MFIYNVKINGGIALKIIIILLSLFMLIVFGISVYRIFFANGKFEVNDRIMQNEITEIDANNYTNILQAVHKEPASYLGMKIKFTGYIYRVLDFEENQFVLARDMVISSDFQTVVVGFLCEYEKATEFEDSCWVVIEGEITKGEYRGEIPIIKIEKIEKTNQPSEEFVYPPDDSFVPTSTIL